MPGGGDLSSDGDAAAFGPCSCFESLGYFSSVVFPDGNGTAHVVPGYVIIISQDVVIIEITQSAVGPIAIPYNDPTSFCHVVTNDGTTNFFQVTANGNSIGVIDGIPHHDSGIFSLDFIPDENIIGCIPGFRVFNISAKGDVAYIVSVVTVYAAFGVFGIEWLVIAA